jgi:hypothetical protein
MKGILKGRFDIKISKWRIYHEEKFYRDLS